MASPSNIECLERLQIPAYPPLAGQGSVEQSLQVKSVDVGRLVERFFKEGAENALENSRFSKACGGKTITLVFHFANREGGNCRPRRAGRHRLKTERQSGTELIHRTSEARKGCA